MSSPKPNKVVVLVEHLFIPEEIAAYRETFESNGFVFEEAARLWGKKSDTFYSDNISDIAFEGEKPRQELVVSLDVDEVRENLSEYAAVLVAANYTSVRSRYFDESKESPRQSAAHKLIAQAMSDPRIVKSALCHGLWLFTPAPELLAGRRVRCHEVVRADVENTGAFIETKEDVVVDGDLVTGHSKKEARLLAGAVVNLIREVQSGKNLRPDAPPDIPTIILPKIKEKRRILIVLSNFGYWGEELIGPLDVFDQAKYHVDFCTPNGQRPNALQVSKYGPRDKEFYIDPPLGRGVTTNGVADKVKQIDDKNTTQGKRLDNPLNLSKLLPERPYVASTNYVRALEAYNRNLERMLKAFDVYDALLLVGGSGPMVDMVNNGRLHELILHFVKNKKVVGAECYGVPCLAFARNWEERKSIIWGKRVTGHCLEYDYKDGTGFMKDHDAWWDFPMGPPPYPLEYILRDAVGPDGAYIGNFGKERSVIVDFPFVTGRSTPDSYLTGERMVWVLEGGEKERRFGW